MHSADPLQTAIHEHRLSVVLQQLECLLGRVQHGSIELVFVHGRLVELNKHVQPTAAMVSVHDVSYCK